MRCATVIDMVLAITKLPTNSAMPPNASSTVRKMPSPFAVSLLAFSTCASAVRTCAVWGRSGRISFATAAPETPSRAATWISSSLPLLSASACAVARLKTANVPPPVSLDLNRTIPATRY